MSHICASVKQVNFGSDDELLFYRHRTITWTKPNVLTTGPLKGRMNRNTTILLQENCFEKVICKTIAILPRPSFVKLDLRLRCIYASVLSHDKQHRKNMPLIYNWNKHMVSSIFYTLSILCTAHPMCLRRDFLCMHPSNARRQDNVTSPPIGCEHAQDNPCLRCSVLYHD